MSTQMVYRVRPGFVFGVNKVGPGTLVTMTEHEAQGFLDKLELVAEESQPPVVTLSIDTQPMVYVAVKETVADEEGAETVETVETQKPRRGRRKASE